jgi:hypothetical protein
LGAGICLVTWGTTTGVCCISGWPFITTLAFPELPVSAIAFGAAQVSSTAAEMKAVPTDPKRFVFVDIIHLTFRVVLRDVYVKLLTSAPLR